MLRKALLVFSGNAAASLLSLVRNLLIARLLSVEDYGIAATFAVVMTLIEMATALGLQVQIVQAADGDDPDFQASVQGFQLMRGVAAAMILFLAAGAIAQFLKLPELAWAYRVVALVPLVNGLVHFDIYRMNRQMQFRPMILSNLVPMVLTLLLVWPLVQWLEDWRAMLAVILIQVVTTTAVSHLVAVRPYRLKLDPIRMRQSLDFGWPLLISNALLFLVFQGDRALVARELGPETLAIFSMGVTLTLTPTLVMAKTLQNLFLPRLSRETDPTRFAAMSVATMQGAMLNASVMLVGVYFLAPPLILTVLGEKYLPLIQILGALAVVQALRVLKTGGNVVALSRGQTGNTTMSNAFRVAALPVIWWQLAQGNGLDQVILWAAVGEAAGYAASLALVRWRLGLSLRAMFAPLALSVAIMSVCAGLFPFSDTSWQAAALMGLFIVQLASMSALRHWIARHFRPKKA